MMNMMKTIVWTYDKWGALALFSIPKHIQNNTKVRHQSGCVPFLLDKPKCSNCNDDVVDDVVDDDDEDYDADNAAAADDDDDDDDDDDEDEDDDDTHDGDDDYVHI